MRFRLLLAVVGCLAGCSSTPEIAAPDQCVSSPEMYDCGGCACRWEQSPVRIGIVDGTPMSFVDACIRAVEYINAEAGCPVLVFEEPADMRCGIGGGTGGVALMNWQGRYMTDCSAVVGKDNLARDRIPVAVHEILHCLGFYHDEPDPGGLLDPTIQFDPVPDEYDVNLLRELYCR